MKGKEDITKIQTDLMSREVVVRSFKHNMNQTRYQQQNFETNQEKTHIIEKSG